MSDEKRDRIRDLNDAFRWSLVEPPAKGKLYMTAGVAAHGEPFGIRVVAAIALFDAFKDLDPRGLHDMVRVMVDGVIVYGKIDYFAQADPDLGSEDPSDEAITERVMTILLPEEY